MSAPEKDHPDVLESSINLGRELVSKPATYVYFSLLMLALRQSGAISPDAWQNILKALGR